MSISTPTRPADSTGQQNAPPKALHATPNSCNDIVNVGGTLISGSKKGRTRLLQFEFKNIDSATREEASKTVKIVSKTFGHSYHKPKYGPQLKPSGEWDTPKEFRSCKELSLEFGSAANALSFVNKLAKETEGLRKEQQQKAANKERDGLVKNCWGVTVFF